MSVNPPLDQYNVAALGAETAGECSCCGREIFEGEGALLDGDRTVVHYGYRWACGTESRFTLGICPLDEEGNPTVGLAVVSAHSDGESLIYAVREPEESPWSGGGYFDRVLTRKELLEESALPNLFTWVDAISAREPRIYSRVLAGDA